MLAITDGGSLTRALSSSIDPDIKRLLIQRRDQLVTIEEQARFIVMQPRDTLDDLEKELGFLIAGDDEHGFGPEWVADHGTFYEAVWILTDDGFAHVVMVPHETGIDASLLNFCRANADEQLMT